MIRDTQTSALIETDLTELDKYRKEKKKMRELKALRQDVDDIKRSISKINFIIKTIAEDY